MTAFDSALAALAIGDGKSPETFSEVPGIRVSSFTASGTPVVQTALSADGWESLLATAINRSLRLTGVGILTGSAGEAAMRAQVLAGNEKNYRLTLPDGGTLQGAFALTRFEEQYDRDEAAGFRFTLQSSGAIVHTAP